MRHQLVVGKALTQGRRATSQMVLRTVVVAALVAGCTGAGAPPSAPTETPVASLAARPIAVATAPPATPAPTASATPVASSNGVNCGDTTAQAITNDMVRAPQTLPLTRKDFADRWNKHAGDTKTGYGLGKWTTLATSGSYTSLSAPIPATDTEDQVWSIDYDANYMASIALMMSPGNVTYSNPLVTGQLVQTMLSVAGQGPSLLRELGVTLPLDGYRSLQGINACAYSSFGADLWVRLVQVSDYTNVYYLYVRSPSAAEKEAALARQKAVGPSTPQSGYAYPALGPEAFAGFAPPLSAVPDVSGNPEAWITPIPSLVIKITNPAWDKPFIGAVIPLPDGSTVYRYPDADGTPLYRMTNPFNAAQMASGVDLLTFVGSDNSLAGYPPGVQMNVLLSFIANTPTGEGLFYIDGQRVACSWVGGTLEKPKRGSNRDSVSPLCGELGGA